MASVKFPTLPNIDFSKLELPKFDMPKFDMPKIDTSKIDSSAVTAIARDAAYVTIGLAVLAFQTAQVRRREITKALTDQFGSSKAQIDEIVDAIESRLAGLDTRFVTLEDKLDAAVEDLEKRLPERAGALLGTAHDAAKTARQQVRSLITPQPESGAA